MLIVFFFKEDGLLKENKCFPLSTTSSGISATMPELGFSLGPKSSTTALNTPFTSCLIHTGELSVIGVQSEMITSYKEISGNTHSLNAYCETLSRCIRVARCKAEQSVKAEKTEWNLFGRQESQSLCLVKTCCQGRRLYWWKHAKFPSSSEEGKLNHG